MTQISVRNARLLRHVATMKARVSSCSIWRIAPSRVRDAAISDAFFPTPSLLLAKAFCDAGEDSQILLLLIEWFGYARVLIFNSANCPGATALGESVMRSDPLATLGKAITSRSDLAFAKSITVRSSPMAIPPCGGVP